MRLETLIQINSSVIPIIARKDLAWLLGVDGDVMDTDYRRTEVGNWIEYLVLPVMVERR